MREIKIILKAGLLEVVGKIIKVLAKSITGDFLLKERF